MAGILWLDDIQREDRRKVGNKAATLGFLRRGGFPVPPGFCITLEAAKHVTPQLWAEIEQAYRMLAPNGGAVAVRSSGVAEDSPDASFAGQYETVLNVHGPTALRTAIEHCWCSATAPRVRAYKIRHQKTDNWLAVLVQQQVSASVSGVLFTVDPVSGSGQDFLIEAAPGLGEALVSGHVVPAQYRVERSGEVRSFTEQNLLAPAQCRALAEMGRRIETLLGRGQDIEWALSQGQLYVLQARPVTTASASLSPAQVWTRANIGEVLPGVVTPLTWDVFRATLLNKPSLASQTFEDDESGSNGLRRIRGRAHLRLDGLLDSFCYLPTVTPEVMTEVLGVERPAVERRYVPPSGIIVRLAQAVFWLDVLGFLPRMRWLVKRLPPVPAVARTNIDSLLMWSARCFRVHLKCTAYAIGAFGLLARLLNRWLPTEARDVLPEILIGRENLQTALQGVTLTRIAEEVQANAPVLNLIKADMPWAELTRQLAEVPAGTEFLAKLQNFLETNGARSAGEFELAVARWREDPSFIIKVLHKLLDRTGDEPPLAARGARQQHREQSVRRIAAALPAGKRWIFHRVLASYSEYSTLRENVKYRLMEGYAALRSAFLDVGNDLVGKGVLARAEDVFFLKASELFSPTDDQASPADKRELVQARLAKHRAWEAAPAAQDIEYGCPESVASSDAILTGIGCSPGMMEGYARVLFDVSEAGSLSPGEILVAPHTDPGWTPLFLVCGAIVTETGGFLSHGATVAREYGTPTVVNVIGATKAIRSGDYIRVDGTRGHITIRRRAATGGQLEDPADHETIRSRLA